MPIEKIFATILLALLVGYLFVYLTIHYDEEDNCFFDVDFEANMFDKLNGTKMDGDD